MDGWITIGTKLETKQFDKQIEKLEREIADYENILKLAGKLELSSSDVEDLELKIEKAKNSIISLKKQQMQVNDIGFNKAGKELDKISDKTGNIIKKVGRWALAVFSVRSAYMFVQRASSTLAQYDEQYAANLEYIRFVLAQMIAPVLQGIVNLAFKLLSYINAIANAWFGVNLFSKAGVKNFNKMAGAAASIKKSLQTAGFDEMNVLSDTSSGGGGGGAGIPSMDLSKMQGEVPSWMQWILDNKDTVIAGLLGIAGGIIAINLGVGILNGLGLGLIVAGIVKLIGDLVDLIIDPSWEKFGDVLIDIGIILAGLALIIGGIPLIVAAAVALIVGLVIKYWDEIVAVLSKVGTWIYDNVIKPVGDFFVDLWNTIKEGVKSAWNFVVEILVKVGTWIYDKVIKPVADFFKGLWDGIVNGVTKAVQKVKDIFNTVKTFFTNIITTIINLFKTIGTKVGDAISKAFKAVINTILKAVENILNSPIRAINGLVGVINKVPGVNLGYLPTFSLPRLAVGGIVNMPGRGVPIGGAITGEVGKEGVIPLTNSQAMQELGETIGRYITINANITNSMNGKVISRQIQKIMANQDFAYNT